MEEPRSRSELVADMRLPSIGAAPAGHSSTGQRTVSATTEGRRPPGAGPALLISISVDEAAGLLGIGRTRCYQLVLAGRIRSVKVGRRRLVVCSHLDEFVNDLLGDQPAS